MYQNTGTVAILGYQANPLGIELDLFLCKYFFFVSLKQFWSLVTWVETVTDSEIWCMKSRDAGISAVSLYSVTVNTH